MEAVVMYVDVATRHCTLERTAQIRQATTSSMENMRMKTNWGIMRYPRKARRGMRARITNGTGILAVGIPCRLILMIEM